MTLSKRRQSFVIAGVLLFCVRSASALVLYGSDTGGTTDNTAAPSNGAPWNYVASLEGSGGNASGVYLGYGYVLTANHVNTPLSVSISGSLYALDSSYVPLRIGDADLKLLRILGDPGLEPLQLIGANDSDLGKGATFVGWGVGKGSEMPNQGWYWGDDSTRMERWGTNVTGASYVNLSDGLNYLATSFDRPGAFLGNSTGEDEFSLSLGDSGGGLFVKYGNTWKLTGIAALVEGSGQALYDKDASMLRDQPTRSFYTPIKAYRNDIIAAIPEPSAANLLLAGGMVLLGRRRVRRSCAQYTHGGGTPAKRA